MRAALLVTTDEALTARVLRALTNCSVFTTHGVNEALQVLRVTEPDLVLVDVLPGTRESGQIVDVVREFSSPAVVVCVYPADGLTPEQWDVVKKGDFLIQKPFTSHELASLLRQAQEKQGLTLELATLRARQSAAPAVASEPLSEASNLTVPTIASVLKELAKPFSAGFDSARTLEMFLDVVGEMLQPSRAAMLLATEAGTGFRIAAQRGLAPHLVKSLRLAADAGLPRWLAMRGRPAHVSEFHDGTVHSLARDVARELKMLHAVIAVPVLAQGEVIAILSVGQRITGVPYSPREVEMLFDLSTQMAVTIRHLRLHHQLQYEKAYTERVLSQMSSGLVSIDQHEKVAVMNRRAEGILGISAGEVVNNDLRRLPSPLGDLLYDSLRTGRTTHRLEVQLASPKLPLEVSTYPIAGPGPVLGAALFFEDLSAAKQLAAQKRLRDQFELLARLVARLAADIRRPLVSVQTFMELFEERFDEPEFRERFVRVMKHDAGQLVQMFEKLSALVSEREFSFETIEIRKIVEECLAELDARPESEGLEGTAVLSFSDVTSCKRALVTIRATGDDLIVKCDRAQLKKAISYLLWYLVGKSPSAEAQLSLSVGRASHGDRRVQLLVSSSSAELKPNEVERLFDLLQAVEDSLVELGPFISRKILEAQNGGLRVAQRGRHVTFVMELPLAPR